MSEHLAPRWHIDATLEFLPFGTNPPAGNWWLRVLDDTDYPPDSGYHNVDASGTPYGKVFVKTAQEHGENWTITASHELLEMLVNPYAIFAAYVPFDDNTGTFYNLEICDPVSPDVNGYKINEIWVSDFVYPEWFSPFLAEPTSGQAKQVDYCGRLIGPAPALVRDTTVSIFGWRNVQSPTSGAGARKGKDALSALNRAGTRVRRNPGEPAE